MRARSGNVAADPDNLCGGGRFYCLSQLERRCNGARHKRRSRVSAPPCGLSARASLKERNKSRLLDVPAAADYIGRSPSALRHLIAKGTVPCVRRDGRVLLDRRDLDNWVELSKTGV